MVVSEPELPPLLLFEEEEPEEVCCAPEEEEVEDLEEPEEEVTLAAEDSVVDGARVLVVPSLMIVVTPFSTIVVESPLIVMSVPEEPELPAGVPVAVDPSKTPVCDPLPAVVESGESSQVLPGAQHPLGTQV